MGDEDYWLAISRDKHLLGGGFFVTRSYALTSAAGVRGLQRGDSVDVHTAGGLDLVGQLFEVAEDVGLALISVLPDPLADYATPLADHAVKGDAWRAPYRPSLLAALLRGTVDAVTDDVRDRDGPPLCVLELTSDRALHAHDDYAHYAGGPVERRTEGRPPAVVGVLLSPDAKSRRRDGAADSLTATALSSAVEAFDALSAENLMGLLCEGLADRAGLLRQRTPVPAGQPDAAVSAGAAASAGNDEVPRPVDRARDAFDAAEVMLRSLKQMSDEGVIDARTALPFHVRILEEVVREVWRRDEQ
ncbi:hypothetical protein [Streptomyces griseosporeus]|uniref:hypothetical protein n=1 Tax=Streptomyces griseosporeus TaxID=1910 RepID=UPI0036F87BE1